MSQVKASDAVPIEAPSPFELRVNLAAGIPENVVKEALVTGNMGFLHSFTTGSAVDGPGVRVVAWTAGCQWRCLYCHNPDTWNMMNGIPVTIEHAKERLAMYQHGLKTFDPERHLHLTGKEVGPTHAFARRLGQRKKKIWVRYVLVPGLTDDEKDIEKTAQLAAELGTVERVDVLPFHQMGRYKWEKLGIPYTLDNTQTPSAELVERTCAQFKAVGLKAV